MEVSKNRVLIIGGPTGSGESTITKAIISRHPIFQRLVTATSRAPRSFEKDEDDYYFFSKEEFEKQITLGNILEYTYVENRDTYYGTYEPDLNKKLSEGHLIVNVDYVGVLYYKEHYGATAIFIKPESIENLRARLLKRNPEIKDAELNMRLKNAKDEVENEEKYYDYTIINKDGKLEEAILEAEEIIKKEKFII